MPEGDTVWLTARRLHEALAGRPLTTFELRVPALATADLRGRTVREVTARGKHILVRLPEFVVHSHLRMDGSWFIGAAGRLPRHRPEHLIRALAGNDTWLAVGYRVHDLRIVPADHEHELVGHLGPDLLGPDWDADEAVRRLRERPDRPIGEALLDQRNLAGIGNLYKCETLFVRRVNPWTPVGQVVDLPHLVRTGQQLIFANRNHPEQSTTGYLARGRRNWVYQRSREPCLRCATPIKRADQGGAVHQRATYQGGAAYRRATYWCPTCQPSSRPGAEQR